MAALSLCWGGSLGGISLSPCPSKSTSLPGAVGRGQGRGWATKVSLESLKSSPSKTGCAMTFGGPGLCCLPGPFLYKTIFKVLFCQLRGSEDDIVLAGVTVTPIIPVCISFF